MIVTRVVLQNFKAYKALDLEFEPGATFVVARNGTGKTSLVEGAMWALFGDDALDFSPREAIRGGSNHATARIELSASDGQQIKIERHVSATARSGTATELDGAESLDSFFVEHFGAPSTVVRRLSVVAEGQIHKEAALERQAGLLQHVVDAVGGQSLTGLRVAAKKHAAAQFRDGDASRRETRAEQHRVDTLEGDLAEVKHAHQRMILEDQALRDRRTTALEALRLAQVHESQIAAVASWAGRMDEVLSEVRLQLGLDVLSVEQAQELVRASIADARTKHASFTAEAAKARARIEVLEGLSASLLDLSADCPLCRRPITSSEAAHARARHADEFAGLEHAATLAEQEAERVLIRVNSLGELERALSSPQPELRNPAPEIPVAVAQAEVDSIQHGLEVLASDRGSLEQKAVQIESDLRTQREILEASELAVSAYRAAEINRIVQMATENLQQQLQSELITPLLDELRHRWKSLWFDDSRRLVLSDDGFLSLESDGSEVPFSQLSGGERTASLLVARLLALQMTTRARLLWMDEPWEHLDSRNRRILSNLILGAARSGSMRQLVATTYEESVTRQLRRMSESADHPVSIVYVRAEER